MRKNDTFHSFHDLDGSRFRKADIPLRGHRSTAKSTAVSLDPVKPAEIEDESAIFLTAVMDSMDVSLKYTSAEPDKPVSHAMKKAAKRIAPQDPPAKAPGERKEPPATPIPSQKPDDATLFAQAMDNVHPINARGRDLAPAVQSLQPMRTKALANMDDIFFEKLEFSLEYTDEFIQGHVLGLDSLVLEKLKAGAYSPEAHVDLHGQNMEQAYATLTQFVRHAYQNGKRHLIVVTGRGKNSPGGVSILRERVQAWLTREPFKRVVLGFCSAKPEDGGAGAVYLLLRKRKKNHGKIIWNNTPSEEELLL